MKVNIEPFRLPNFVRPTLLPDLPLDVGSMTDDEARAYWRQVEERWVQHVAKRRINLQKEKP